MKKKMIKIYWGLFVWGLSLVQPVKAWDMQGHTLIAEIAFLSMQSDTREALNRLFASTHFPRKWSYLGVTESWISEASVPDLWKRRSSTARDLFRQHGVKLPSQLLRFADFSTREWHYLDQPYFRDPATKSCILPVPRASHWDLVIPKLLLSWKEDVLPDKAKRMVVLFLIHLIADAHQPLHGFSLVQEDCELDKGGNDFCLRKSPKSKRCQLNLHAYWDKGLELPKRSDLQAEAQKIIGVYPQKSFGELTSQLNPSLWAKESFEEREWIYRIKRDHLPSDAYQEKKIEYSRRIFALAGYRLAAVLDALMKSAKE